MQHTRRHCRDAQLSQTASKTAALRAQGRPCDTCCRRAFAGRHASRSFYEERRLAQHYAKRVQRVLLGQSSEERSEASIGSFEANLRNARKRYDGSNWPDKWATAFRAAVRADPRRHVLLCSFSQANMQGSLSFKCRPLASVSGAPWARIDCF